MKTTIVICGVLFSTTFLLSNCSTKNSTHTKQLTKEERADLEYFFRLLLFHDNGAYVLFGSKPMCLSRLVDSQTNEMASLAWLNTLNNEKKAQWEKIQSLQKKEKNYPRFKRNPYNGWKVWEKLKGEKYPAGYLLIVHPDQTPHPLGIPTGIHQLYLVNIQETAFILNKYYSVFHDIIGKEFDPLEAVFEIENPDSDFWKHILSNHKAKGLLCGFGEKNVLFFEWSRTHEAKEGKIHEYLKRCPLLTLSTHTMQKVPFGTEGPECFDLPTFESSADDDVIAKFEVEKRKIKACYKHRDLVEVTVNKLLGTL